MAQDSMDGQDMLPSARVHYDFRLTRESGDSFFGQKDIKENLRQWGIEDTLTLTQVQFCPTFMVHEETTFLRQLLTFIVDNPAKPRMEHMMRSTKTSVESVQWERLKCTAMSMDFFNCLIDKGDKEEESKYQGERIVSKSGNIRGCFPDVFDGVTVSDKLRELLVNPDSENADAFSPAQQEELLFHVFRVLAVGGGVCQPDDSLEPYTKAAKALYKDLVSVHKNASTGKLEIAASKVYRVTEASTVTNHNDNDARKTNPEGAISSSEGGNGAVVGTGGDGGGGGTSSFWKEECAPSNSSSPHSTCLVVVDLAKKRASVLWNEFLPFW
ncbi:unnamed protein product [Ectocarpus sp. CCAP 1310/34]|nr:unnamed protein product [Ectocarpus sp. CCAP 1310/34]